MPQSWLGVAQALAALGAPASEVSDAIERALRIGMEQPSVIFAAGHLYDRLGDTERADELFAETLVRYPSLAADPYWERLAGSGDRFERVVDRAMDLAPDRAWELALMRGDAELARTLAVDDPTSVELVDAWTGSEAALAAVFERADDPDQSADLRSWASRLAARNGDVDAADRFQRLAVFQLTEGGELPGTEIRVDEDGYLDAIPAGTEVGYAGHYLYRRPLPPDLLPPGLPRLIFTQRDEEIASR
jgi:hypothetical protein